VARQVALRGSGELILVRGSCSRRKSLSSAINARSKLDVETFPRVFSCPSRSVDWEMTECPCPPTALGGRSPDLTEQGE
jgi:hypothetical protein